MQMSETLSQTPFNIKVRKNLQWDFSRVEAKFVDHPSLLVTFLWAGASTAAPPIESFFVKTLLPVVESIGGDEKLERDVRDMIAQEAQHSANHRILNNHLQTLGYDVDAMTAFYEGEVAAATGGLTAKDMLGVVAFGEHALYSFASVYLNSAKLRKTFHPQVDRLFLYHFLEEAEHGAVSHDQYRYFYRHDYWHRLRMAWKSRRVSTMLTRGAVVTARGFGYTVTLKDRLQLYWYLWVNPGPMRGFTLKMLEYLSPWYKLRFTHEDAAKLARWDRELLVDHPAAPGHRPLSSQC